MGASRNWAFLDMAPDHSDTFLWTSTTTMPFSGEEEFVVVRDYDREQTIFPKKVKTWDTSVPVMGPSDASCGRAWAYKSTPSTPVTFALRIVTGNITLMVTTVVDGTRVWQSLPR